MLKVTYDVNNNGIVDNAEKVNNHTVEKDVPANAVFTDTTYSEATTSQSGLMSSTDKNNLDSNTGARHTHSNKSVLDGIDSTDITNWNNKVDNTDYASLNTGGTVRVNPSYGINVDSTGTLIGVTKDYSNYSSSSDLSLIDKGTLENVIEGKGLIDNTYYSNATTTTSGLMSSTDKTKLNNISGYYGTCATGSTTASKVVECENFVLEEGAVIYVKFTNANAYNGTATLNVNDTGAKDIARVGTTKTTRYYWTAGELVGFIYDGTNYLMMEKGTATTTYYGLTKLATSATSTSDALALTPKSLNSFAQGVVANYPVYSTSGTYEVGDRVRYSYGIYECITAIPVEESWTAEHWTLVETLQEQIDDKEDKSNKVTSISSTSTNTQYPGAKAVYDFAQSIASIEGDTLPIGAIIPFSSDTIPENWLLCDGQAVSRTIYQELFSSIGTTYGNGDGSTTFNLPDLQGKIPVGLDENDTDFDTLGNTGGEKEHTLTINEMPSHSHGISANAHVSSQAYSGGEARWPWTDQQEANRATWNAGGGQAHNNLQPYIVQNYIIKAKQSAGVVATVVDTLTSTSATDALSAKQGNVLKGETIYENSIGANDNITLSKSIANFTFIEVYYSVSIGNYTINDSKKSQATDNMDISLSCEIAHSDIMQIFDVGRWHVSGTSISKVHETDGRITSSGYSWTGSVNRILIKKIVGYNY